MVHSGDVGAFSSPLLVSFLVRFWEVRKQAGKCRRYSLGRGCVCFCPRERVDRHPVLQNRQPGIEKPSVYLSDPIWTRIGSDRSVNSV